MDEGRIYYLKPGVFPTHRNPKKGSGSGARLFRNEPALAMFNSLKDTIDPNGPIRIALCWKFRETNGRKCKACGPKRRRKQISKAINRFTKSLNNRWLPENVSIHWTHQSAWKRCGSSSASGRFCSARCSTYMFSLVNVGNITLSDLELLDSDKLEEYSKSLSTDAEFKLYESEIDNELLPASV